MVGGSAMEGLTHRWSILVEVSGLMGLFYEWQGVRSQGERLK